jgi:hypothetical protein
MNKFDLLFLLIPCVYVYIRFEDLSLDNLDLDLDCLIIIASLDPYTHMLHVDMNFAPTNTPMTVKQNALS